MRWIIFSSTVAHGRPPPPFLLSRSSAEPNEVDLNVPDRVLIEEPGHRLHGLHRRPHVLGVVLDKHLMVSFPI